MKRSTAAIGGIGLAIGIGAGVLAIRRMYQMRIKTQAGRWHTVTVNKPYSELSTAGQMPEPLAMLDEIIEIDLRPAPRNQGTEIAGRIKHPDGEAAAGDLHRLRKALRNSKSLLETGEILGPDRPSTTRRTLFNLPLDIATRFGREEGRL
jgi:hypothetical protein